MSDEDQNINETNEPEETLPKVDEEQVKEKTINFVVDSPIKAPRKSEKVISVDQALSLPMSNNDKIYRKITEAPNIDFQGSERDVNWMDSVGRAFYNFPPHGQFNDTAEREDSDWGQLVNHEGEDLKISKPRTGGEPSNLSGERAIFRLNDSLGLGTVAQIPLWHTGIWISFKTPTDGAIFELEQRLVREKEELGRETNGFVFSNRSVYQYIHMVEFALKHLYDSSLKTNSVKSLKREILVTDIPTLLWGVACSIYPNGYNLFQPCINDPEKCNHVMEERVNLARLSWVDRKALSGKQRSHMAKRTHKWQHQDLVNYQNEHERGNPRLVKIHDKLSLRLKVPTIAQYEEAGYDWINDITNDSVDTFDTPMSEKERKEHMQARMELSYLKMYSHWISEIILEDGSNIDDRDTINDAMERITSNREMGVKIVNEIVQYIDDCTISMIAIPNYKCPKCGTDQSGEEDSEQYLIPLGVIQVFFTLITQRLNWNDLD